MGLFMNIGYIKANWSKFQNIDTITGSSGGAVIGLFLALGWHPERVMDALLSIDPEVCAKTNVINLIRRFGFIKSDNTRNALENLCECNPTFNDLEKTLYVSAFSLTTGKTVYFSKHTHPDMLVLDAVMASIAIPILIEPVRYKGELFIDGGFAELWPSQSIIGCNPEECFVIRTVFYDDVRYECKNLIDICKVMVTRYFTSVRDDTQMPCKHVKLDCSKYDTVDFKMDYDTKLKMIMDGTIF